MNGKLKAIGKYNEDFNNYLSYNIKSSNIYQSSGLEKHIIKRRPDCLKYIGFIPQIIADPDYVGINPNELAAFGPLRRSEICGLEDTDFNGNIAHIQRAVVLDENKQWVNKTTKSVAGNRYVPFPNFVIDRIRDRKGRIVHFLVARSGLPRFRFHDLRHYCASIQHALGVPDAYIMQRGGWGSDAVLKQVYRHALSDQSEALNHVINDHFSKLCSTKYHTK